MKTKLEKMNAVVRILKGSGYKMGDLFTLIVGDDEVKYDTREWYEGRGKKYNKSIRHGDIVITMTERDLNRAYKPIAEEIKRNKAYEKRRNEYLKMCKKPVFIAELARKKIAIVGKRRFENYGMTEEEYLNSTYNSDGNGLNGFHAQPDEGYRGCGVYRIAIKNGKITATLYGGYHNSRPDGVDINTWIDAVSAELSKYGEIVKADGSGCSFFLREMPEKETIKVKEYNVPSIYGGYHHNIEVITE